MREQASGTDAASTRVDERGLDERDRAVLAFERERWSSASAKDEAIRDRFSMSPTRYYQLLAALTRSRAALEHDPMLVKRLVRVREERSRARAARAVPPADR